MTSTENTATATHRTAGHDLWVRNGVVTCDTCDLDLDTSGARPGLVAANQAR